MSQSRDPENFLDGNDDDVALIFASPSGNQQISRGEFRALTRAKASAFSELFDRARQSQRPVALVAEPELSAIVTLAACLHTKTPALLLHPRETEYRKNAIIEETGALSLSTDNYAERVTPTLPPLPQNCALALGTSGSSGSPKWVLHSWSSLRKNVEAHERNFPWQAAGDRWLLSLPFSHVGGFGVLFRSFLARQTTVVAPGVGPTSSDFAAVLAETGVTLVSVVPTQLRRWLETTNVLPPQVRGIFVGGAHLPERERALGRERGWPLLATYGMTEFGSQVSTENPNDLGTGVGRALEPAELRLDSNGRIYVRGPAAMLGYWGRESPFDSDGWFRTNDGGHFDERGHLHVIGRLDQIIITGGENVAPEMIEEATLATGLVSAALAKGRPDPDWGERVVLFVAPAAGVSEAQLQQELPNLLRTALPAFARPKELIILEKLPTLPNGKLARAALK